jgi:hypothetical protein
VTGESAIGQHPTALSARSCFKVGPRGNFYFMHDVGNTQGPAEFLHEASIVTAGRSGVVINVMHLDVESGRQGQEEEAERVRSARYREVHVSVWRRKRAGVKK